MHPFWRNNSLKHVAFASIQGVHWNNFEKYFPAEFYHLNVLNPLLHSCFRSQMKGVIHFFFWGVLIFWRRWKVHSHFPNRRPLKYCRHLKNRLTLLKNAIFVVDYVAATLNKQITWRCKIVLPHRIRGIDISNEPRRQPCEYEFGNSACHGWYRDTRRTHYTHTHGRTVRWNYCARIGEWVLGSKRDSSSNWSPSRDSVTRVIRQCESVMWTHHELTYFATSVVVVEYSKCYRRKDAGEIQEERRRDRLVERVLTAETCKYPQPIDMGIRTIVLVQVQVLVPAQILVLVLALVY